MICLHSCSVDFQLDNDMTPKQIVDYLNKHIVGQHDAKRAIAIAMVSLEVCSEEGELWGARCALHTCAVSSLIADTIHHWDSMC